MCARITSPRTRRIFPPGGRCMGTQEWSARIAPKGWSSSAPAMARNPVRKAASADFNIAAVRPPQPFPRNNLWGHVERKTHVNLWFLCLHPQSSEQGLLASVDNPRRCWCHVDRRRRARHADNADRHAWRRHLAGSRRPGTGLIVNLLEERNCLRPRHLIL